MFPTMADLSSLKDSSDIVDTTSPLNAQPSAIPHGVKMSILDCSRKAIEGVKNAVNACLLAGTLAMGAAPAMAGEAPVVSASTTQKAELLTKAFDIKSWLEGLDATRKSKITPEFLNSLQKFWLNADEINLLSFAIATNLIKDFEFWPRDADVKSALDSIDNQLSLTLPFNKPLSVLTGGSATITVENYPQFIESIYGSQRIPTVEWRRTPLVTTDAAGVKTTTLSTLTQEEVTEYDTKQSKQADGLKTQFAKLTPEEREWIVSFLNNEAETLSKNNTLNTETIRRLVLIAGAINASKKPNYFYNIALGSSIESLDVATSARYNDRLRRTSADLANWTTLTGKAEPFSTLKLTTDVGAKWTIVNASTIENSKLGHLKELPVATMSSFIIDLSGGIRTAMRGLETDRKIAEADRQSAEADRQSAEYKQQIAEAKQQSAEYKQQSAESKQRSAEADQQSAEYKQQSIEIKRVGNINEEVDRIADYLRTSLKAYPTLSESEQGQMRALILPKITLLEKKLANLAELRTKNAEYKEISTSVDTNLLYINAALIKLGISKVLSA